MKTKIKSINLNLQLLNETKNFYAAMIYGYLQEAQKDGRQVTPDGYFMCTNEEIQDNVGGLTRYQQSTGLNVLSQLGMIHIKLMGFPAFRFIKVMEVGKQVETFEVPTFDIEDNVPELPDSFKINGEEIEVPDLPIGQ